MRTATGHAPAIEDAGVGSDHAPERAQVFSGRNGVLDPADNRKAMAINVARSLVLSRETLVKSKNRPKLLVKTTV